MRKLILGLVFAGAAFAACPTTGVTFGVANTTVCPFDVAYLASQPTAVEQALSVTTGSNTFGAMSVTTAQVLASQGYFIDVPIMVWGWDPYFTMLQRIIDQIPTYPDATGTKSRVPSTNPADYPPLVAPVEPVSTDPVGAFNFVNGQGQSIYSGSSVDSVTQYPNGSTYTDSRGTFIKTAVQNPFGWSTYWTLNNNTGSKNPVVKKVVTPVKKK